MSNYSFDDAFDRYPSHEIFGESIRMEQRGNFIHFERGRQRWTFPTNRVLSPGEDRLFDRLKREALRQIMENM